MITEEEFLDILRLTTSTVTPQELLTIVDRIDNREAKESFERFKRGVEAGKEIMIKVYNLRNHDY